MQKRLLALKEKKARKEKHGKEKEPPPPQKIREESRKKKEKEKETKTNKEGCLQLFCLFFGFAVASPLPPNAPNPWKTRFFSFLLSFLALVCWLSGGSVANPTTTTTRTATQNRKETKRKTNTNQTTKGRVRLMWGPSGPTSPQTFQNPNNKQTSKHTPKKNNPKKNYQRKRDRFNAKKTQNETRHQENTRWIKGQHGRSRVNIDCYIVLTVHLPSFSRTIHVDLRSTPKTIFYRKMKEGR